MKKYIWIMIVFLLTAGTILMFASNLKQMKYLSQQEGTRKKNNSSVIKTENKTQSTDKSQNGVDMPKDHSKMSIDCKTCHYCEYPTKTSPCLLNCPRTDMISVHHTADEGPEVVELNMIDGMYGEVVFSHKLHAGMSEMSGGCTSCHHYNTTGPVLKCITCHEPKRIREDLSKPDLEAAYHRQCLSCHRQWSRETKCQACHINQNSPDKAKAIERIKGIKHPPVHEPQKIVYETNYDKGKIVTFHHDEHTKMFKVGCVNCHQDENCTKCHDVNLKNLRSDAMDVRHKKVHKSFEEHHKSCNQCHKKDDCSKCHRSSEMTKFNHLASTGFDLGRRHSKLQCSACHKKGNDFAGLSRNCSSCHNDIAKNTYNHEKVGLIFDDTHSSLECTDCHVKNNFMASPVCADCHDDKTFPKHLPGKKK